MNGWTPKPLVELGDQIGRAIMLVCEYGVYVGGLKTVSKTDILIEVGEGQVIAVDRKVLDSDLTELYIKEVI